MSNFVHLHVHDEFSTLDGINRTETLPQYVRDELGQNACAQTNHGTLSGAYKFTKACRKAGIKPILGLEAYYSITDIGAKEKDEDDERYYHMVLLAKNGKGFKNLMKLSEKAYTENMWYKPRLHDSMLADNAEGIIATTACLGARTSKLILLNRRNEAERLIQHHAAMFDDFFIELQLHEDDEQQAVNKGLLDISRRTGIPLILTNDSHYTHVQDKKIHEMALTMQTNDVLSNPNRFSFGDIDVHLAHHDWMKERVEAQGIPYEAISNTQAVADLVQADEYFADRRNRWPTYKHLPEGVTAAEELEYQAKTALMKKFNGAVPPQEYRDRINQELRTIKRMGFSDYMLIVAHLINTTRDELGAWHGPGRGSVGGSLVAYALGITQLDPIKYGMLFSRFLNEGRAATPLIFNPEMVQQVAMQPQSKPTSCSHLH